MSTDSAASFASIASFVSITSFASSVSFVSTASRDSWFSSQPTPLTLVILSEVTGMVEASEVEASSTQINEEQTKCKNFDFVRPLNQKETLFV